MMMLSTGRLRFGTKSMPELRAVSVRQTVPAGAYRAFIADSAATLSRRIASSRLKIAGAPFAVFHDRLSGTEHFDVSVYVPVRMAIFAKHPELQTVPEAIVAFVEVPAGSSEDAIKTAYGALERYVCDNDWIFDGDAREAYPHGTGGDFEIQMPVER